MTYESQTTFQIPESCYTSLFEALPGNSILLGGDAPRFTILAATPAYLQQTGCTREDILGKGVFEAFPANYTDPEFTGGADMLSSYQQVLQQRQGHAIAVQRYDLQNEEGGFVEKYWKISNEPVFSPGGDVAYIIHTAEDVTAQHQAAQNAEAHQRLQTAFHKIEESEQRFRALVTATSNMVYRMSADWSEMRELQGRDFLSDTGDPITGWLSKYIHPNDQPRVMEGIQKAIATKSRFEMEHQVVRQDGATGWVFSRAIPVLDQEGAIIEWFGAANDITQRKETEEALQATIEEAQRQKRLYETITSNTPDLMYVFDLAYRFTYVNEAVLAMWGKPREEAIGKGLLENGYEPWHAEMHHREIDQVVATRQPIRGEVSFPHAQLGKRIYDYIFVPVINEKGEVEAVAGTTRDITEIRKAEEVLRQSSEKLEALVAERTEELRRSNKELEGFAYAASHDLKEPIRKLHFFSDRLKEQLEAQLTVEQKRYFERLGNATERMGTLIDDLLAYSQTAMGLSTLEEIDLNTEVKLVVQDLELEIEQKGAHITIKHLPAIKATRRQMQQLFYNLLSNALKYSKPGTPPEVQIDSREVRGADVRVKLSGEQRSESFHLITVKDNGVGFPQEDAERIFNVFTRLYGNSEYEGTGVGLAIVRRVVENHNGVTWAESAPGKGSTFYLLLPKSY